MANRLDILGGAELKTDADTAHARVVTEARPGCSMGELRAITGWNFDRDRARRGRKRKPRETWPSEDGAAEVRRYDLRRGGYYLADGTDANGERLFAYIKLEGGELELLERERVAEDFFASQGLEELREAVAERQWRRAWERLHFASADHREKALEILFVGLRDALAAQELAPLEGRELQLSWANSLRARGVALLRALYKNFTVDPQLPRAHPRVCYALLTAAWNMKAEPHAGVWIAADYHIQRDDTVELVERFAQNGKRLYEPRGRAEPLTRQDLELLRRLGGRP